MTIDQTGRIIMMQYNMCVVIFVLYVAYRLWFLWFSLFSQHSAGAGHAWYYRDNVTSANFPSYGLFYLFCTHLIGY